MEPFSITIISDMIYYGITHVVTVSGHINTNEEDLT